jgi:hypothetical protein
MAMEVKQVISGAHEDSIIGLAYNRLKREIYSVAEGDKAIKVLAELISNQQRTDMKMLQKQPIPFVLHH